MQSKLLHESNGARTFALVLDSVDEQVEVLSIVGHVTREPGGRNVHAHAVLGKRDGTAVGGHLLEGHVEPTLELVLTESPSHLRRRKDEETGLALIDLDL